MPIGFSFDLRDKDKMAQRARDTAAGVRQDQRAEQAALLKPLLNQFGPGAAQQLGGMLLSDNASLQSLGTQQLQGLQGQSQGQDFQRASLDPLQAQNLQASEQAAAFQAQANARAEAANQRAAELHPYQVAGARFARDTAEMEMLNQQGQLPETATIQTIEPGSQSIIPRTVPTPTSGVYQDQILQLGKIFRGRNKLTELTELTAQLGTEFTGPTADRMEALVADATLAYAEAKGMGALQAPDLELAQRVIKNPTSFTSNVEGILRSTAGAPSAIKGMVTGEGGGFLGLSRQDQIEGFRQAYGVAKDDMDANIVQVIQRNPLLLGGISDADLAAIAPDIAEPLMPYLQALGRDPWQ